MIMEHKFNDYEIYNCINGNFLCASELRNEFKEFIIIMKRLFCIPLKNVYFFGVITKLEDTRVS